MLVLITFELLSELQIDLAIDGKDAKKIQSIELDFEKSELDSIKKFLSVNENGHLSINFLNNESYITQDKYGHRTAWSSSDFFVENCTIEKLKQSILELKIKWINY
jgi:hypothetical protein